MVRCRGVRALGRRGVALALLLWAALALLLLPALSSSGSNQAPPPPQSRLLLQSDGSTPASSTPPTPAPSPPPQPPHSDDELREAAARRLPSLPLAFWHRHKDDKGFFYKKKECAPLPSVFELEWADTYWQTLRTRQAGTFHVWGAYLDRRPASRLGPAVRLLAVHDRVRPTLVTHCQLWFHNRTEPVLVRTLEYKYVWNAKWGNHRDGVWAPYLLACVLPADVKQLVPAAVSLVEAACDRATNLLKVTYEPPPHSQPPEELAVCVKGLDFMHEDMSVRLVEWLELLKLLGAGAVHLYELQVHSNVSRVLDYYKERGFVTVTPLTLPAQPNLPELRHMYLKKKTTHKRQMELVPYNDCLYRHMYRYRRLALLDVDEVIVPLLDDDWPALLRRAEAEATPAPGRPPRSSYHASNVYYLDTLGGDEADAAPSAPRWAHMLRHEWRTRNFTKPGQYVKAFHETGRVLALHNHFPLACLGGACSSWPLPVAQARLQHYRADCVAALTRSCAALRAEPVRDAALNKWAPRLLPRVAAALRDLALVPLHELRPYLPPER